MFNLFGRPPKTFKIQASWDAEAEVWYVVESDVPGLHAEGETLEELFEVLKELVPELVGANVFSKQGRNKANSQVPIELITHRKETLSTGC
jgi:predicted RNase H-like HicB family nuclease